MAAVGLHDKLTEESTQWCSFYPPQKVVLVPKTQLPWPRALRGPPLSLAAKGKSIGKTERQGSNRRNLRLCNSADRVLPNKESRREII